MTDFVLFERDGPVATLTLNRPDSRNTLSRVEDMRALADACQRIRLDQGIRAVILTGAGSAFCAGGDIKDMRDRQGMFAGSPYEIRNGYRDGIQRIPLALWELEVPVIAAINGAAIGAGLDLACMADIRIASDRAKFAESFVKLGIVPGDGGAWFLPRIVGLPRASVLALTGDPIDAETALQWTLVTEIMPLERLMERARELAGRIAANPAHALRLTKRLLREGQHLRLDTLLELSSAFQALAHHTPEHAEALAAMVESRSGGS